MPRPDHEICARWLELGGRAGLALLVGSFAIYVFGLLPPLVPPQELTRLWHLPLERYLAVTGAPTGWGWLGALGRGDYLNFVGIALLASVTALACAAIVPALVRGGYRLQALCAVLQILMLLLAASGIF